MAAMGDGRALWAPTAAQRNYLARGLGQPGGKLPLFDEDGQAIDPRIIRACLAQGWAMPWFANPIKPDFLVCRLTEEGRRTLTGGSAAGASSEMRHNVVNCA